MNAATARTESLWNSAGGRILRGKKVHFLGLGGIGVSGLARLAMAAGAEVSGCDSKLDGLPMEFAGKGCRVWQGHSPDHLDGVDVLVHTAAAREDEPEIVAARARGVEIVDRLPMLLRLSEGKRLLGVAGSHGKTSTSALISKVMIEAGLDPSCVVGGVFEELGGNSRTGDGEWFVAELDESDGWITGARCELAILTNVDREHFDHYASFEAICRTFAEFAANVTEGGAIVACEDSVAARVIARASGRKTVTYGFSPESDYRIESVRTDGEGSTFDVVTPTGIERGLRVSRPGLHYVQNATAVLVASALAGVDADVCRRVFGNAPKVGRRFEVYRLKSGARLVVDYAHHPAEIAATVSAASCGAEGGRTVAVFQPHRYTRTKHLGADFGPAFAGEPPACFRDSARWRTKGVDELIVLPIYAASEPAIEGVSSAIVADAARAAGVNKVVEAGGCEEAFDLLSDTLRPGDTAMVLGAGDIYRLGAMLRERA